MPKKLEFPTEIDLTEFISKEAHDLKSPFNRIHGFIKMVQKGMDGPIPDQARDDLTTAYLNSLHAASLMSGLIEMARLSQGSRKLTLSGCPADGLLKQAVVDWKKTSMKENQVQITVQAPPAGILVDEFSIRQGLSNWISFVVSFMEENIQVEITAEEEAEACLFTLRGAGKKLSHPPECELTMYHVIARQILDMHHGVFRSIEADEHGVSVQFTLPKA